MDFETFLKDYIWVPIVIGVFLLIIVLLLVWYCYSCCRRRSHPEYMPLTSNNAVYVRRSTYGREIGVGERLDLERQNRQKSVETTAWMDVQYYLRANGRYSDVIQLDIIGSRPHKSWFRVNERRTKSLMLMSMTRKPEKMIPPFTSAARQTLKDMIDLLQHPFIYPIHDIDFMVEQNIIVVVYPVCKRGSLKDYIYQSRYDDAYRNKYISKRKGLSVTQIKGFGKQILMALSYMEEKGFPPHGHVHCGNIVVESNCCRLMGIENSLTGEEPRIYPLIRKKMKQNKDAIDVICFGHLIYEMCVGEELDSAHPQPGHLNKCRNPDIVAVLNFIFPESGSNYPSLKEIADQPFFSRVPLPLLDSYRFAPINMNKEMRNIVKNIRKGEPMAGRRKSRLLRTSSNAESLQMSVSHPDLQDMGSNLPATNINLSTMTPQAPPVGSVAAPPPPMGSCIPPPIPGSGAPPPPPMGSGIPGAPPAPPQSQGRSALLGDIRKGTKLKKTTTNDKSAPKL